MTVRRLAVGLGMAGALGAALLFASRSPEPRATPSTASRSEGSSPGSTRGGPGPAAHSSAPGSPPLRSAQVEPSSPNGALVETREERGARVLPPPKKPEELVYELDELVARRSEFRDSRSYWERFDRLKQAFAAAGPAAAPLLEDRILAEESPPRLRRASVTLLGRTRSKRSLPLLAELVRSDGDEEVRRLAARSLARYRPSPRARQILIEELLHGRSFHGTYALVASLSQFRNRQDIRLFQQLATSHEDVSTRMQAIHALGTFRDRSLVPFLESVAGSDPHTDPRVMAKQVLQDLER